MYQEKCNKRKNREDNIPITKNNAKLFVDIKQKDLSQLTYYNYNKRGYIFRDYIKLKNTKTSYSLDNFNIDNY